MHFNELDQEETSFTQPTSNSSNNKQNIASSNVSENVQSFNDHKHKVEIHVNPDNVKYNKICKPCYSQLVDVKCDSCTRNSTRTTDIEIKTF